MNKPSGYDEVQVGGDYTPIELGGHHLVIKGVREEKSKSGKDMIVVAFDCAKNDKQPGYFSEQFDKDIRPEKKWPNNGTQYILTMDSQDASKTSKSFKSFITSFERSNGCEAVWGDKFCTQFKNKKIGGVFGLVEEEYNGEIKRRHKLRWFCEDSKVDEAAIPADKLLNTPAKAPVDKSAVLNIPDTTDEEIPF